jgi:hypothetical protein
MSNKEENMTNVIKTYFLSFGRDRVTMTEPDALAVAKVLRLCNEVLRLEAYGDEPPVFEPEELRDLIEQVDDCYHLICDRIEERPPAIPVE